MIDERNILCAEVLLSKYFYEHSNTEKILAKDVLIEIKGRLSGLHRAEIKEARKRLSIKSKRVEDEYQWEWDNPISPEAIWSSKSKEFFGG